MLRITRIGEFARGTTRAGTAKTVPCFALGIVVTLLVRRQIATKDLAANIRLRRFARLAKMREAKPAGHEIGVATANCGETLRSSIAVECEQSIRREPEPAPHGRGIFSKIPESRASVDFKPNCRIALAFGCADLVCKLLRKVFERDWNYWRRRGSIWG